MRPITFVTFVTLAVVFFISTIPQSSHGKSISKEKFLSPKVQEKVRLLRQLSSDAGLPQANTNLDLCYSDGCLDAAFDILSAMNGSVDPCSDFFQFSCGLWMLNNPIPPTQEVWAAMSLMVNKVRNATLEILREPVSPTDPIPLNQAKEFFSKCMDEEALERTALAQLKQAINSIGGWQLLNPDAWDANSFDWLSAIARTSKLSTQNAIFSTYVQPHPKDSDKQVIFLDQPTPLYLGFGIPRAFLINRDANPHVFAAYETYIYQVARELDSSQTEDEIRSSAKDIIAFEEKLAKIANSDEDRFEKERLYNPRKLKDYQGETDGVDENFKINWTAFLKNFFDPAGVDDIGDEEELIVQELGYVENAISQQGTHTVANYIVWRFVAGSVRYTTEVMRNITREFERTMYGNLASELPKREITCVNAAESFGMVISSKYLEREYDDKSTEEVKDMIINLKSAFEELVNEADWMKNETKVKAIEKKEEMASVVGYPDWIMNKTALENYFKGLELKDEHVEDLLAINIYFNNKALGGLRRPTDRELWLFAPNTVNAYHVFNLNSIVMPAGFLLPPFFEVSRPRHQNYGGIGVVIGHEVTHGFDKQGAQYDKNGNVENWWDDETKQEYDRKGQCMAAQYSKYCYDFGDGVPFCINGDFTLGENIGDNGGLWESFRAYKLFVEKNGPELRLPGLENFSTEQLFFIGYANIWCEHSTSAGIIRQLLTDPHSPGEWRVNGAVRNSFDFAHHFSCPVNSDGMNPPADEKCQVW